MTMMKVALYGWIVFWSLLSCQAATILTRENVVLTFQETFKSKYSCLFQDSGTKSSKYTLLRTNSCNNRQVNATLWIASGTIYQPATMSFNDKGCLNLIKVFQPNGFLLVYSHTCINPVSFKLDPMPSNGNSGIVRSYTIMSLQSTNYCVFPGEKWSNQALKTEVVRSLSKIGESKISRGLTLSFNGALFVIPCKHPAFPRSLSSRLTRQSLISITFLEIRHLAEYNYTLSLSVSSGSCNFEDSFGSITLFQKTTTGRWERVMFVKRTPVCTRASPTGISTTFDPMILRHFRGTAEISFELNYLGISYDRRIFAQAGNPFSTESGTDTEDEITGFPTKFHDEDEEEVQDQLAFNQKHPHELEESGEDLDDVSDDDIRVDVSDDTSDDKSDVSRVDGDDVNVDESVDEDVHQDYPDTYQESENLDQESVATSFDAETESFLENYMDEVNPDINKQEESEEDDMDDMPPLESLVDIEEEDELDIQVESEVAHKVRDEDDESKVKKELDSDTRKEEEVFDPIPTKSLKSKDYNVHFPSAVKVVTTFPVTISTFLEKLTRTRISTTTTATTIVSISTTRKYVFTTKESTLTTIDTVFTTKVSTLTSTDTVFTTKESTLTTIDTAFSTTDSTFTATTIRKDSSTSTRELTTSTIISLTSILKSKSQTTMANKTIATTAPIYDTIQQSSTAYPTITPKSPKKIPGFTTTSRKTPIPLPTFTVTVETESSIPTITATVSKAVLAFGDSILADRKSHNRSGSTADDNYIQEDSTTRNGLEHMKDQTEDWRTDHVLIPSLLIATCIAIVLISLVIGRLMQKRRNAEKDHNLSSIPSNNN